ncbi:MAG: hypothetical protein KKG59_01620 [Nanoarchaeota archaeon]|nr:hypothetical protein [Nanoarchaeota archaeon]
MAKKQLCEDCLKWHEFGNGCRVFWEGKTFCTMKVISKDEWDEEARVLRN